MKEKIKIFIGILILILSILSFVLDVILDIIPQILLIVLGSYFLILGVHDFLVKHSGEDKLKNDSIKKRSHRKAISSDIKLEKELKRDPLFYSLILILFILIVTVTTFVLSTVFSDHSFHEFFSKDIIEIMINRLSTSIALFTFGFFILESVSNKK